MQVHILDNMSLGVVRLSVCTFQPVLIIHHLLSDGIESQYQSQWQQLPCPADCPVNSEMSNQKQEMTIDEGTITVSSVYSQKYVSSLC